MKTKTNKIIAWVILVWLITSIVWVSISNASNSEWTLNSPTTTNYKESWMYQKMNMDWNKDNRKEMKMKNWMWKMWEWDMKREGMWMQLLSYIDYSLIDTTEKKASFNSDLDALHNSIKEYTNSYQSWNIDITTFNEKVKSVLENFISKVSVYVKSDKLQEMKDSVSKQTENIVNRMKENITSWNNMKNEGKWNKNQTITNKPKLSQTIIVKIDELIQKIPESTRLETLNKLVLKLDTLIANTTDIKKKSAYEALRDHIKQRIIWLDQDNVLNDILNSFTTN